jgi:hypothetical protein
VSMIANINPSNHTYEESHNTLKYANRAKAIKVTASNKGNCVTRVDSPNDERIAELRAQNQELRQQLVLTQRKVKRQHSGSEVSIYLSIYLSIYISQLSNKEHTLSHYSGSLMEGHLKPNEQCFEHISDILFFVFYNFLWGYSDTGLYR